MPHVLGGAVVVLGGRGARHRLGVSGSYTELKLSYIYIYIYTYIGYHDTITYSTI